MNRTAAFTALEKRQLRIFLLIAFGFTFLMGIPLGIAQRAGLPVDAFPNAQMYYPAAGVMLACLLTGRCPGRAEAESGALLPRRFFGYFVALTAVLAGCCMASLFTPELGWGMLIQYGIMGGTVLAWIFLLTEKKEKRAAVGLRWAGHKTAGRALGILVLFLALYLARTFVSVAVEGALGEYLAYWQTATPYVVFLSLPISFLAAFTAFFGEEYGWRYYFQPLLQKRFGKIPGTLLLGVLWGLWHLPLDLFFYSPETSLQSIAAHQITCITLGVFFAFAYLSTNNIWVPVLLHFLNNNMIPVITGTVEIGNQVYGWGEVAFSLVLNGVIFLPFLASKVFRKDLPGAEG